MEGFNLFNIGFGELTFILILAGIVMGPERIRQVARYLGNLTARLQRISQQFRQQLNDELDGVEREQLQGAMSDIQALKQEVAELRREVLQGPQAIFAEGKEALEEGREAFNSIGQTELFESPPTALPNVVEIEDDP